MNWKLIFQLSLFGFAMAFATVYLIPSTVEPLFWLAIFIISASLIAKGAPAKYFLHGLMVSIVNSVWITAAHFILYEDYAATHAQEIEMMSSMPGGARPWMLILGPFIGVISGVVLGLFALIAAKILSTRKKTVST